MKDTKPIKDEDITTDNYASITTCNILDSGTAISFTMPCGSTYQAPIEFFKQWFSEPHYLDKDGALVPYKKRNSLSEVRRANEKFVKCEHILNGLAVRVFLSGGAIYDVAWDVVLMACERRYEHFGGLTDESKKIIFRWHNIANNC